MQTFIEHYYLQEKLSSDIRRAFTSNLFKKRKVGVDLGRGKYKKVIEVSPKVYDDTVKKFQNASQAFYTGQKEKSALFGKKSYKSGWTSTIKKLSRTDISDVYEGEIDSGEEKIQGTIDSVVVYQVRNGARIAFIISDNGNRKYISTNTRGNDFFRENLGTTLEQLGADSKPYSNKSKDEEEPERDEKPSKVDTEENPTDDEIETEDEYGIMDISLVDMNNFENQWGDGKKGPVKGGLYEFKNRFKKERQENFGLYNNYDGYKYFDNVGNAVYLIDLGDSKNASIGFKDRNSYNWAKRIGMLQVWKIGRIDSRIHWEKGDIENLP